MRADGSAASPHCKVCTAIVPRRRRRFLLLLLSIEVAPAAVSKVHGGKALYVRVYWERADCTSTAPRFPRVLDGSCHRMLIEALC